MVVLVLSENYLQLLSSQVILLFSFYCKQFPQKVANIIRLQALYLCF